MHSNESMYSDDFITHFLSFFFFFFLPMQGFDSPFEYIEHVLLGLNCWCKSDLNVTTVPLLHLVG